MVRVVRRGGRLTLVDSCHAEQDRRVLVDGGLRAAMLPRLDAVTARKPPRESWRVARPIRLNPRCGKAGACACTAVPGASSRSPEQALSDRMRSIASVTSSRVAVATPAVRSIGGELGVVERDGVPELFVSVTGRAYAQLSAP